jgi:hypothetical protein
MLEVLAGSAIAKPRSPSRAEKCQERVEVGGARYVFLLAMSTLVNFMMLKLGMILMV